MAPDPHEDPVGRRDRWQTVSLWAGAAVGVVLLVALLLWAMPYGAAARMASPFLAVIGGFPQLPDDLDPPAQRSVVLAADETPIAFLAGEENRVRVPLADVPDVLVDAVVAIEDEAYFEHAGIDHRAAVRAALANLRAGEVVQGASTITMQYAGGVFLPPEQTFRRKAAESRLAIQLERRLSKAEILERYLNEVYFGDGVYGVATAAERYFGKAVTELDVAEAALLAGLVQAPERLDPAEHPDAAAQRRDVVLERMTAAGRLDRAAAEQAMETPLDLDVTPLPPPAHPFFVEHVKQLLLADEELAEDADARERLVFGGGLVIHTTLDLELQGLADRVINETLTNPERHPQTALLSLEPDSGAIRTMAVGPHGFGTCPDDEPDCPRTEVNPIVPGLGGSGRQPGSAFKPVVIAAALDEGMPPGWQQHTDGGQAIEGCRDEDGEPYAPDNFDPADGGVKDMYEAIRVSNNVYHAKLAGLVDPGRIATFAEEAGFGAVELPDGCALALGSATVFPIEMAAAFSAFAAEGERCEPFAIARVERGGATAVEHEPDCEEILDPELAAQVTDILLEPVRAGTATAAQLDRPVAGKTGTTDDFRDAWFVGYVPQLLTVTWVGYERPAPLEGVLGVDRMTGGSVPAELWAAYMDGALADVDPQPFPDPPSPVGLEVPDVVGQEADAVEDAVGRFDLNVEAEEVPHWTPEGTVVSQEPEGGERVARGHLLTLEVSDGAVPPPTVPDVMGRDQEAAERILTEADYEVEVVEQTETTASPSPPDDHRTVVDQDPETGTVHPPGETVTITVVVYEFEGAPVDDPGVEVEISGVEDPGDVESEGGERVILRHDGLEDTDVSGWFLLSDIGGRLVIGSGYSLAPGGELQVFTGSGTDTDERYFNDLNEPVLHPEEGWVEVYTRDGQLVDRLDY